MNEIMLNAACLGMMLTMVLALIRAILGPTVYDRILAVNMFGTKTVLFIGVVGFVSGRPAFLDIALVYALMLGHRYFRCWVGFVGNDTLHIWHGRSQFVGTAARCR
jgi:multicomponent Na+:H+ antiporter subunit F